ncbi:ATP-binding protein [Thioclava nitratireducens]|uniref:ATP-binding protein n=1 Tax=Thioclava nitratireducens TaxID=1915078 RepID=UPI0024815E18|nr:ATP-binding protein [Thioclava nitratireducens]WGT50363.1 ATP-binding protein [Thioclava nitratireducens]
MQADIDRRFRPRARLLQHLGDQLIGTPRLAVFELVKNAYDADASKVEVEIAGIGTKTPTIRVTDDGTGMSLETVRDIWLVIAHDHKERQLEKKKRTAKGRLPLGSKGLGRLSVHKLGNQIRMVTRAENSQEVVVDIDWNKMIAHEFLSDAEVDIEVRDPEVFTGKQTGTLLQISELREKRWTRGEVRRLYRQITSISSPFGQVERDDFQATLLVPDVPQWIERLPDPSELLKRAPWKYTFEFDGENFSYHYSFSGIPGIQRKARDLEENVVSLLVPPLEVDDDDPLFSGKSPPSTMRKVIADLHSIEGIGPISGEFYVFDLTPRIAKQMGETKLIKDFLDENGGIRVYRDGIRVYDYGERSNDWLGLDLKRVNNPTRGLSRNIVVGHVSLDQDSSPGLVEKSNREGFIENETYERFRQIVLGAIDPLQREREVDRKAIRELLGEVQDPEVQSIMEPVSKIRVIASKNNLSGKIDPLLDRIEHEYVEMKNRLLATGISGTSLAVVFHEIEQGVRSLYKNMESHPELEAVTSQVEEMMKLLDGFSDLLRKKDRKPVDLRKLIKRARDLNRIRFRHHNVKLVCPAVEEDAPEVTVSCSFGLTLGAITNIIDNAIYWMRAKWPNEESSGRAIYIGIDEDFDGGPAIIIADTGPGFRDAPSELVRPFYTRRPEGMGMGLYYANMVMELNDGALLFPDHSQVDVPDDFEGAVIALQFAELKV